MNEPLALQKILMRKYEELKDRNPHYSRRAFSRKLGVSPGAMSELFNGRRRVSSKLLQRIAARLALDPQERAELLDSTSQQRGHKLDQTYLQLTSDQFRVISDWPHFAILTLMRTKAFKSDVKWVAARLGLSFKVVGVCVDRMARLGLIKVGADGKWMRSKERYRTTDDVANLSVRRAHFQYLEKAREALENISVDKRDFTSLMVAINPKQLPIAKERIRKFQDELAAVLEEVPGSEVFQLCIQLFPLTNLEEEI